MSSNKDLLMISSIALFSEVQFRFADFIRSLIRLREQTDRDEFYLLLKTHFDISKTNFKIHHKILTCFDAFEIGRYSFNILKLTDRLEYDDIEALKKWFNNTPVNLQLLKLTIKHMKAKRGLIKKRKKPECTQCVLKRRENDMVKNENEKLRYLIASSYGSLN